MVRKIRKRPLTFRLVIAGFVMAGWITGGLVWAIPGTNGGFVEQAVRVSSQGSPLDERPPTPEEIARSQMKEAEAKAILRLFNDVKANRGSMDDLRKSVADFGQKWGMRKPAGPDAIIERLPTDADPSLGIPLDRQETNYYCGPASVWMCMAWFGAWESYEDGTPLSQANLATKLGTTSTNGTSLSNVPGVMNRWLGVSWYVVDWAPSAQEVYDHVAYDYAYWYPVVFNAYMSPTYKYLDKWDPRSPNVVRHYVAGDGYDPTTKYIRYNDPYDGTVFGDYTVPGTYGSHWVPSALLSSVMTLRGMVW